MEWKFFLWFWGLGMLSVVIVQTSFVPEEYWQSLEPAHNLIFGYGKLTWEWSNGIRSYAYPCIIAFIYKILAILHLDYVNALIYAPRILQATISAIGHYCTCELATIVCGKDAMYWTAATLSTNWFIFYCMSRTLFDTIETVFVVIAIKHCGWNNGADGDHLRFVIFTAISCIIQPSAVIIFFPVSFIQYVVMGPVVHRERRQRYKKLHIYGLIIALFFQIVIDYSCYGTFLITPAELFAKNLVFNIYEHYGTHPFYWYILIGLPTVLFTHLGILVVAVKNKTASVLLYLCAWILLWYSWFSHQEIRFLLPVVSLLCCVIGIHLKKIEIFHKRCKRRNWDPTRIIQLLFITNLPLAVFFGCVHQRGTLDAMQFLAEDKTPDNLMNISFLMPCYSMPAYSHLHRNVSLQFLSCEPNLNNISNYVDETDMFYKDPNEWISRHNLNASTHIVIFDTLKDSIWHFLQNFKLCAKIFHTNYPSNSRISSYVEIYCK